MRKLVVLSADAMVSDDMELLRTLPNFKRFLSHGARVDKVRSIYPTITYPVHATVSTGVYPSKHGILLNGNFEIGNKDWNWFADSLKWEYDIFRSAKEAGLSTAAVFWPVTGNHRYIDYLIDEYWTQGEGDTVEAAFARSGSNEGVVEIIKKHKSLLVERKHPMADDFVIACACDIIREYKPDLLMIHPANIDAYRHSNGVFNSRVDDGIYETDKWLGDLFNAMKEAGTLEETDFVLMSDHGQIDVKRIISLNVFLTDAGLITLDENGRLRNTDAYIFSGGCSAYCKVYNKDRYDETAALLYKMRDEGIYGISEVFTREEISAAESLDGDFDFVIETDGYTAFNQSCVRPVVKNHDFTDYRYGRATHGYLPDKGPQPTLAAAGPHIRNGTVLEKGKIIDLAPTFAALLGVDLPGADGEVITEIIDG